ncbi:MAG: c-type cytochrome [Gemmatimonadetes bacterium]|nr:c-type cytochrome [Gemmatimonadota bacterium]
MSPVARVLTSLRLAVTGLALAWHVTAPASWAQESPRITGDPIAGRRMFVERGCVDCHSIWGNGGTLGPDFALVGAGRSLQQLAGLFWNHTPRMIETVRRRGVAWPTFTADELADFISYVYYVKLFDEPGSPELGERWFREMRCRECHSLGGVGAAVGPALDSYARYPAPIRLAQGMWNSGPAMRARLAARGVPLPVFLGREVADLQAYIRQASSLGSRDLRFLEPPDPNAGRRLFVTKSCVVCHGADGHGSEKGPPLHEITQRRRVSEIAGLIWNHSGAMATALEREGLALPRFTGTEMADVIAFLYYLRYYETGGDAREGERLFEAKGCARCHARDGSPSVGPDLSQSDAASTLLGLAAAMWDHAPAMYDLIQTQRIEWPRFEGDEMRNLSIYLQRLSQQKRAGQ